MKALALFLVFQSAMTFDTITQVHAVITNYSALQLNYTPKQACPPAMGCDFPNGGRDDDERGKISLLIHLSQDTALAGKFPMVINMDGCGKHTYQTVLDIPLHDVKSCKATDHYYIKWEKN